jgi:hypothetical protein
VYGAHVVAFNPANGKIVAAFTLDRNGNYTISGLDPGAYIVRVEPIDDLDLESFFSSTDPVNTNFAIAYYQNPAVVASGQTTSGVDFAVARR